MFSQLYSIYVKNMLILTNFGTKKSLNSRFWRIKPMLQSAYILRFGYIAHHYNGNNGNLSIFHSPVIVKLFIVIISCLKYFSWKLIASSISLLDKYP